MVAMIPTKLAFFEVEKELIFADAVEFKEAMLSEAPERFDAVDVVLSASEFVLVVMDTMMAKAAGHKAIVGFPAIGVNVARRKDIPSENRHQLLPGAVLDDADEHPISSFVKSQDGNLSPRSSTSLSSHPSRSKVAFIDLDVPSKRFHLRERHFHHSISKQAIDSMHCSIVKPCQLRRRQRRQISPIEFQNFPKFALGNPRSFQISVLHC